MNVLLRHLTHATRLAGLAALLLAPMPPAASAQGFIAPFVGASMGGDTVSQRAVYGVTFGVGGTAGLDFDFGRAPGFFDGDDLDDRETGLGVSTLMLNLRLGSPTVGAGVKPYVSGGIGLIRSRLSSRNDDIDDDTRYDFGVNLGAGLDVQFGPSVALRGDLRYFRSRSDDDGLVYDGYDTGLDSLRFWRATAGIVIRFD